MVEKLAGLIQLQAKDTIQMLPIERTSGEESSGEADSFQQSRDLNEM